MADTTQTTDTKENATPTAAAEGEAVEKKVVRRNKRKTVIEGRIYIDAGFNNTIVTIADNDGKTIAWSSAGAAGFKGSKKSTPYAAQVAAEGASEKAKAYGFERANVFVRGIGHGREQALRGIIAQGISIINIFDTTPIPHNGCRKPRTRRV